MKYKAFNIQYDTDGEDNDLPKEIEIEIPDEISNKTGFCHLGFEYKLSPTITEIKEFLNSFCTKVRKKETSAYVELMMYDHKCIEYNKKQYYVPENNGSFTPTDELICDFLTEEYSL